MALLAAMLLAWNANAAENAELTVPTPYPKCNELNYTDSLAIHPDAFGSLEMELVIDDYRGWVKKKIKSYVSLAKRGHARKEKRTGGTITFHTKSGVSCTLKIKFRPHGDLDDHYPDDMNEEPSLNAKLVDGHIFGITKFVLFRPETRNGKNEVFAATMLGKLGFLAPRTTMATLRVVGNQKPAVGVIFQEKIVKEFLEFNNVREGPIIEGDERFAFGHKFAHLERGAALARISNFKWGLKGPTSMAIANTALSQMNRLLFRYDKAYATKYGGNMYDMVEIANRLENGKNRLKFPGTAAFEAILNSMGGTHGFSQDDRRAIYDPLTNSFIPIYYDGGSSVLTAPDEVLKKITMTAQKGVPAAQRLLEQLDVEDFRQSLMNRGVNIANNDLQSTLETMKTRLRQMETTDQVRSVKVKARKNYSRSNNRLSYVFTTDKPGKLEVCSDSLTDCRMIDATPDLLVKKLMSQTYIDADGLTGIYFAFPKSQLDEPFTGFSDPDDLGISHKSLDTREFNVDLYGQIDGELNKENKTIKLTKTGASGRAVVTTGSMRGWSVSLDDVSGHVKDVAGGEQNFDRLGLTGCLTFIDINLHDVEVNVNKATCEDGVNFVRVSGNVRRASIVDAAYDAVDADFSELKFSELTVENAGNDCLDLSYGSYHGQNLDLNRCGDKAVSVGEASIATFQNILARHAKIGVAVKDFGSARISEGKVENTDVCYELYNKKQEFSGGFLEIGTTGLDCGGAEGTVDTKSLVKGNFYN